MLFKIKILLHKNVLFILIRIVETKNKNSNLIILGLPNIQSLHLYHLVYCINFWDFLIAIFCLLQFCNVFLLFHHWILSLLLIQWFLFFVFLWSEKDLKIFKDINLIKVSVLFFINIAFLKFKIVKVFKFLKNKNLFLSHLIS